MSKYLQFVQHVTYIHNKNSPTFQSKLINNERKSIDKQAHIALALPFKAAFWFVRSIETTLYSYMLNFSIIRM